MKRILFVLDASSIHSVKWVDYFIKQDYEVCIATFSDKNNTSCQKIFYLSNKKIAKSGGNYYYFFSIFRLAQIIRVFQPDYINAHYSYSMGLITLLSILFTPTKASFSIVCHGSDVLQPPHPRLYNVLNKFVLQYANRVFSVSKQITEKLLGLGVSKEKIFTGQYGIDDDILKMDLAERTIDILSNRAYIPNSRINMLLEAVDTLELRNNHIVFILPGISEEKLKSLCTQYPFIIFYESLPHAGILNMVSRTKIYISATQSDGTSLSLLEAMGLGAYPVVSNIASNREWITPENNGELFENFGQLRKILCETIYKNDEFFYEKGKLNRQIIRQYAYSTQMKKIETFLLK